MIWCYQYSLSSQHESKYNYFLNWQPIPLHVCSFLWTLYPLHLYSLWNTRKKTKTKVEEKQNVMGAKGIGNDGRERQTKNTSNKTGKIRLCGKMGRDRTKHRSKEPPDEEERKRGGGEKKKRVGERDERPARFSVFHHAICQALINVSLSLQHRRLAESLRLGLSHPLPLPPLLPWHRPSSISSSALPPPPPPSLSRNAGECWETRCGFHGEPGWEWNPHHSHNVCVCVYAFPPHWM